VRQRSLSNLPDTGADQLRGAHAALLEALSPGPVLEKATDRLPFPLSIFWPLVSWKPGLSDTLPASRLPGRPLAQPIPK
jgi:hypothetical protein